MSLHPAVAFGSVIAGGGLFGPVGALLALPAAAVLQAIGSTYGSAPRGGRVAHDGRAHPPVLAAAPPGRPTTSRRPGRRPARPGRRPERLTRLPTERTGSLTLVRWTVPRPTSPTTVHPSRGDADGDRQPRAQSARSSNRPSTRSSAGWASPTGGAPIAARRPRHGRHPGAARWRAALDGRSRHRSAPAGRPGHRQGHDLRRHLHRHRSSTSCC